jgi:hypothetical protein
MLCLVDLQPIPQLPSEVLVSAVSDDLEPCSGKLCVIVTAVSLLIYIVIGMHADE